MGASFIFGSAKSSRTKFAKLLGTSALVAAGFMLPVHASAMDDYTTPTGGQVVGGAASISQPATGQLNVNQHTDRVVINWDNFNIGKNATTQFFQPGKNSLAVNRVTGRNDNPTQILGTLKANGRVMVLDRNGVFFGKDSRVDVGGIIASTGDVDTNTIMNGADRFELNNFGAGAVVNEGVISAADAGLVALVGKSAANNGVINARLGRVALASGEKATIDLYGDKLVELAVDSKLEKALVENTGTVNAEGGVVQMSAATAKNAVDSVINMKGVINASSVTQKGGKIILSGGTGNVVVSGKMDASGTSGGDVRVTGKNVHVTDTAEIKADAAVAGNGGTALVYGDNLAVFEGKLSAKGGAVSGNGGKAEISAGESVGYYGMADLSAANGKRGSLLIDPKFLTISNAATSGVFADWLSGGNSAVNVNAQSLANTLALADVNLWATDTLSVTDAINLSRWQAGFFQGITTGDLTLTAPTVSILKDVTLGKGSLNIQDLPAGFVTPDFSLLSVPAGGIQVNTVNLDGKIYTKQTLAGPANLAGDGQINSQANTVNVLSNKASIQQGIYFAKDGGKGTVNVAAGTYAEGGITVGKSVTLNGSGAATTQIVVPANGTGLNITASNVDVYGFGFQGLGGVGNTDVAIRADNVRDITIGKILGGAYSNSITNVAEGIVGSNGKNFDIINNEIAATRVNGMRFTDVNGVKGTPGVVAYKNFIHDGATGIRLIGSDFAEVGNNKISTMTGHGIHASGSVNTDLQRNNISLIDGDGILADSGSHSIVMTDNVIDGVKGAGVRALGLENILIKKNTITGAAYGVYAQGGGKVDIWQNDIGGSLQHGIYAEGIDGTKGNIKLLVYKNKVHDGANGIRVVDSDYSEIRENTVTNHLQNGIQVSGSFSSDIEKNIISGAANGIYAQGDKIDIWNNNIGGTLQNGIYAEGFDGTKGDIRLLIYKNNVHDGANGIRVINSDYAEIRENTVTNQAQNGIHVSGSVSSDVEKNVITGVGKDGILADALSNGITIFSNKITTAADAAIRILGLDGVRVGGANKGNIVTGASYGVYADGGGRADIWQNDISGATKDGIYATGFNGTKGVIKLLAYKNSIHDSANGITVDDSDHAEIRENTLTRLTGNGIHVAGSYSADIQNNIVTDIGNDGILLDGGSDDLLVTGNVISRIKEAGIRALGIRTGYIGRFGATNKNMISDVKYGVYLENVKVIPGAKVNVLNNSVDNASRHGISVRGLDGTAGKPSLIVDGNTVTNGLLGIRILNNDYAVIRNNTLTGQSWNGMHVTGGVGTQIVTNTISGSGTDGLRVDRFSDNALISENKIDNVGAMGIRLLDSDGVNVSGNTISGALGSGFYYSGLTKSVKVSGNTVNNSTVGMTFESGTIDLTGTGNQITGGEVGYRFEPGKERRVYLAGNTIGTTSFSGQSQFYVELLGGGLFAPDFPTVINGMDATYDTPLLGKFKPSDLGSLSIARYNYLQDMLWDWNDTNDVGLFFMGINPNIVPVSPFGVDVSDIFREDLDAGFTARGRLSVTILGLPRLPGVPASRVALPGQQGFTTASAAALNNIETAAGDETGSTNAAVLNATEPAAGGQQSASTSCWGDAIAAASSGQVVNYDFDTTTSGTLSAVTSCQNRG